MNKRIVLIGPDYGDSNSFYGGGLGGYTRNMSLYLKEFKYSGIDIIPFFCSSRKKNDFNFISFPLRFIRDVSGLTILLFKERIDAIHILGQYRSAILREVAWVLIGKVLRKRIVYEIKAGQFAITSNNSRIHKSIASIIIKQSDLILVEGKNYLSYIRENYGRKAIYFPNVVALSEIPETQNIMIKPKIKILFVGFCHRVKGVYDIVNAINSDRLSVPIRLELLGEQSDSFSSWLIGHEKADNVEIISYGSQPHDFVLERMKECNYYIYPSRHGGEGHNNSINEAMMNSLVIISSRAGFLGDVLEDCGYLLEGDSGFEEKIVIAIQDSINNPDKAIMYAKNARRKIETVYNSHVQGEILGKHYSNILGLK